MDIRALFEHISGLRGNLQKYLDTKISYYGLVAYEKAVRLLTTFLGNAVIIAAFLIALIFLSGAAALYIGSLLDSYELGLLIVGGFFLLITLILRLFRGRIFGPYIISAFRDVFFKDDDEETQS
jgi:hypothetical protein